MQSKIVLIVLGCIALGLGIIYASTNPEKSSQSQLVSATRTEKHVPRTISPTESSVSLSGTVDVTYITKLLEDRLRVGVGMLDVTIATVSGIYATGTVMEKNEEAVQSKWWALYTQTGWNIIHDGTDFPLCTEIEGMSFPKSMLPACIE